jgi:hypothetical protein
LRSSDDSAARQTITYLVAALPLAEASLTHDLKQKPARESGLWKMVLGILKGLKRFDRAHRDEQDRQHKSES